jgi:HAD superfamily hydrolase (TIGR01509 family)
LLDLDGTLVITEDIYFDVWKILLSKYNICLTPEIFNYYIQGNNDKYVLNTLLCSLSISLEELSKQKDALFIEKLDKIKIIAGVYSFLSNLHEKGHKIAIVTNCNRKVAEKIVEITGLKKWTDFMITSNECLEGKPKPEPYLKAIEMYHCIPKNKCFVFEDSKSGILSGKSVGPRCLVGIETIYSHQELKHQGVDISFPDFTTINIDRLLNMEKNVVECLKSKIIKNLSFNYPITSVNIDETKLKGGFIADVIGFNVVFNDGIQNEDRRALVLKYENVETNMLSSMAKRLELYEREYYFYESVSKYVPIQIPKYYGLLKSATFENEGIIMENLKERNLALNLNLNCEKIEVSLKILERMAQMHTKFWNQPLKKNFPGLYKTNDPIFCPFFQTFIGEKQELFYKKWKNIFNAKQVDIFETILADFGNIQERLATGEQLTLIHGDIKSPNIFYDVETGYEPYFLDWQHCGIGKGAQDMVFFLIESFDINGMRCNYPLFKNYYYKKLVEQGVSYSYDQYEQDLKDAVSYVPFFTAIWFGTTPQDELIDKNWPYFFINKLFYLLEMIY